MGPPLETTQSLTPDGDGPRQRSAPAVELPELHPRGVGEILDISLELLRARFGTCILFPFLLWIPASLAQNIRVGADFEWISFAGQLGFTLLIQNLTVALVTVVVYRQLQGQAVGPGVALRVGLARAPALLVQSVITGMATFVGFLCCIPGILFAFLWSVASAALVLERLGPIAAMARSAQLVRKSFARWAGMMPLLFLLSIPFSGVASALSDPTVRARLEEWVDWESPLVAAGETLLTSLLFAVATAFAAIVVTVFYLDNRVREEGLDLWMRLERLGDEPPPTPGGRDAARSGAPA